MSRPKNRASVAAVGLAVVDRAVGGRWGGRMENANGSLMLKWFLGTAFVWGWYPAHAGLRYFGLTRSVVRDLPVLVLLGYPLLLLIVLIVAWRMRYGKWVVVPNAVALSGYVAVICWDAMSRG